MGKNLKKYSSTLANFNNTLNKILTIAEKKEFELSGEVNTDIRWIKTQISFARDHLPFNIINRVYPKMYEYKNYIINRNEDFFINNKFSKFIKDDHRKEFMNEFINFLKERFLVLNEAEKELFWELVLDLLEHCLVYKKLLNE